MTDPNSYEFLVAQETLILDATEEICRVMNLKEVNRKQLADLIGQKKSHVTQLLSGERNLTLRTLSNLAGALGHKVVIKLEPRDG